MLKLRKALFRGGDEMHPLLKLKEQMIVTSNSDALIWVSRFFAVENG